MTLVAVVTILPAQVLDDGENKAKNVCYGNSAS